MRFILLLLLASCSFSSAPKEYNFEENILSRSKESKDWYEPLLKTQLLEFNQPEANIVDLENGIKVYHLLDSELPIVNGSLIFPKGEYLAKQDSDYAVALAMSALLTNSGAGQYSASQLDQKIADSAARISAGMGKKTFTLNFTCLKSELPKVLSLYTKILVEPGFAEERLRLWKGNALQGIKQRTESPESIGHIAYRQILFKGSPYKEVLTSRSVRAVTRNDLKKLHQKWLKPEDVRLLISGDISLVEVAAVMNKALGHWQSTANSKPEVLTKVQAESSNTVYFIEGDFSQSAVYVFEPGPTYLEGDHYARVLFNDVFGASGFTSRLQINVRRDRGLSYGVYGASIEDSILGKNIVFLKTKAETTVEAVDVSIDTLKELQDELVSDESLEKFKKNIENSFVFKFSDKSSILARQANLEILGFPDDYLDTYLDKIRSVDATQVNEVAKLWQTNSLNVLVVGPSSAYNDLKVAIKDPNSNMYGKSLQKISFDEYAKI